MLVTLCGLDNDAAQLGVTAMLLSLLRCRDSSRLGGTTIIVPLSMLANCDRPTMGVCRTGD